MLSFDNGIFFAVDAKIKILTNNMAVIIYFQSLLFCLIKLLHMRKIIIVMLIILGFASCSGNISHQDGEVYTVEDVTATSTDMTFKFEGVTEPKTFSVEACQDSENYPAYKKGDVVEIENSRLSHVHSQNVWDIIVPLCVGFVVVCIGGFILYLGRLAINS